MLFIEELRPVLNTKKDSTQDKLFMSLFHANISFFSIFQPHYYYFGILKNSYDLFSLACVAGARIPLARATLNNSRAPL